MEIEVGGQETQGKANLPKHTLVKSAIILTLQVQISKLRRQRVMKVDLCPPPKQANALGQRDAYGTYTGSVSLGNCFEVCFVVEWG